MGKKIINKNNQLNDSPIIFREGSYDLEKINKFKNDYKIWRYKDIYELQLTELFQITNPKVLGSKNEKEEFNKFMAKWIKPNPNLRGNYVYFPWSGVFLHMVGENELQLLRTNRTRNLIYEHEQQILGDFSAGVAGMSFGNGIALALVYTGIANTIKIADADTFATTNLNRVRVGLPSVGEIKTTVTAREIFEINPYANVIVYSKGLTKDNIRQFINGSPKLKIVFDVVDDFATKVRIRLAARKAKIPVVMLTSLEDSVLVDVERFDLNPKMEIFHGYMGDITEEMMTKKMTEKEKVKYAMLLVDQNNISYRNLKSLWDIGRKLVSRPHLYSTVSIVCGLAAYITKRIALKEDMPSLRKLVAFHEILSINRNKDDTQENRDKILNLLMKK